MEIMPSYDLFSLLSFAIKLAILAFIIVGAIALVLVVRCNEFNDTKEETDVRHEHQQR